MDNKKKAISLIIVASLSFALMSFFVKLAIDVPSVQKAFYRNFVAVIFMFFILLKKVKSKTVTEGNEFKYNLKLMLKPKESKLLLLRSILGTLGIVLAFYTIDNMMLADSTIISRTSPFFTVITASLFLGEKLNKRVGISMILSFIGILLVIKPTFDVVLVPYIVAIIASAIAGVAYTILRLLGSKGEDSDIIVFYFSVFATISLFPLTYVIYKEMDLINTIYVFLAAMAALVAQTSLTRAYSLAKANDISVYLNLQVIFSAILGLIFFSEIPDIYSLIGYVIIIGSSYWAFNAKTKVGE